MTYVLNMIHICPNKYFRFYSFGSYLKIQLCGYLTKKYTSIPWWKIHMVEF